MSHKHHIITHIYCIIGSPLAAIGVCFVAHFVGVRHVIADRQQHYRKPSAAVGDRFIVPAYTYTPTKWQTDMCVW